MIPSILRRPLRLHPRIFNRYALPRPLLPHRYPEQPPFVLATWQPVLANQPQLLAGLVHGPVLPLEVQLGFPPYLALVQHPRSMDGPVSEVAEAREAEWARILGLEEEVADERCKSSYQYGSFIGGQCEESILIL